MNCRDNTQIEIFCGTGGVGKTTVSSSRALNLAIKGKIVLLITIDPSKRLKQILNLSEENSGTIQRIDPSIFSPSLEKLKIHLDAILMSPDATLKQMAKDNNTVEQFSSNIIIKTLSKPYSGMNEILSLLELEKFYSSKEYDFIILDTPPGSHFLDFLDSARKITQFFEKDFIEIFNFLNIQEDKGLKAKTGPLKRIFNSGVKKLLYYLEKVTGTEFINVFVEAIITIYKNKNSFLKALKFQTILLNHQITKLFLVTSVDQQKMREASKISKKTHAYFSHEKDLIINRCLLASLENWNPSQIHDLHLLKESILQREEEIKNYAKDHFENIMELPEIIDISPVRHVYELSKYWK